MICFHLESNNVALFFFFFFLLFFYFFYNIAQMDGDFIANETYQSVSRNFIELNEPSNEGKK
jgi:hypothetical protein